MKYITQILLALVFATSAFAEAPHLSFQPCTEKFHARQAGPAGVQRMAGDYRLFWEQNRNISVFFMNGTTRQKTAAWKRFQVIDKLVNLSFTQVTTNKADIRVTFKSGTGHWSWLGTECRKIPANEPTMSLSLMAGVFGDGNAEWDRVALHEICHAIGMIHEHQNPKGGIQWNVARVRAFYIATQGWDDAQIQQQVLARYSVSRIRGTQVDGTSIMMYPIPPELTMNGYSVGWNDKLSAIDIWFLDQTYPVNGKPSLPKPPLAHETHYPDYPDGPAIDPALLPIPGFGYDLHDRICGGEAPSRYPGRERDPESQRYWAIPPARLSCAWKEGKIRSHYLWLPGGRLLLQQGEMIVGYSGLI